jgi:hypothetical protein
MTLDDFIRNASTSIGAFTAFAECEIEEGAEPRERTEAEWWDWLAAYYEYLELSDNLASDRRGVVERRTTKRVRRGKDSGGP